MKKSRFRHLTQTFYDPEGFLAHQKQVNRERERAGASGHGDRAGTPNSVNRPDMSDEKYHPVAPEQWKRGVSEIVDRNIIKMSRVLQSLFYLLRYEREEICETGTNKLDFKKAKKLINDNMFKAMSSYNPFGPNKQEFKEYQKISFLKKYLDSLEDDKVEEYDLIMSKLYKWVSYAVELRCEDVVARRDAIELLKKEREDAIAADAERTAKKEAELETKTKEFEEKVDTELAKAAEEASQPEEGEEAAAKPEIERPPFPQQEFDVEFEANNPPIDIPMEVEQDLDNDYDLPYNGPAAGGD